MATAFQDEYVSSSTSIVPDYFTQNRIDLDDNSYLEMQPARKKRGKGIRYLAEDTFDKIDQAKEALGKFEDCKWSENNYYDCEEGRKTF